MTRNGIVVAVLVVMTLGRASGQPSIPASFHGTCTYVLNGQDFLCSFGSCQNESSGGQPYQFSQDDELEQSGLAGGTKNRFAPAEFEGTPAEWLNMTTLTTSQGTFLTLNSLCYPETKSAASSSHQHASSKSSFSRFRDVTQRSRRATASDDAYNGMFSWVPASTFAGNTSCVVDGVEETCETWVVRSMAANLTLIALGNLPVIYEIEIPPPAGVDRYVITYTYLAFVEGSDPTLFADFDLDACYDPPACPKEPELTIVETDLYIFHPVNNFDIAGQDIGDALGDAFFVCETLETGEGDDDYEWISKWTVQYDATIIGQYQNCNGYPSSCVGANDYLIGREAALGAGDPLAGQCQDNNLTGNWLSLPINGLCACDDCGVSVDPDLVLGVNCTWSATRVKTINASCLVSDNDYLESCYADGRAPFYAARDALVAAFDTDVAPSGCPPIGPPTTAEKLPPLTNEEEDEEDENNLRLGGPQRAPPHSIIAAAS